MTNNCGRHWEGTLNYFDANGVSTAWSLDGPDDAPVVVLANGLAADSAMWAPQMDLLISSFRILRYDMRGHGCSGWTTGDYSLELLAKDILALTSMLSLRPVHFIGTSLGAMVGQFIGVRHPEVLSSLILCGTSSDSPRESWAARVRDVRAGGVPPLVEATMERWFTPAYRTSRPEVIEEMRAMVLRTSREGYAGCAAAIRDMDIVDDIHRISVPTLVVAGEDDLSTPIANMERIANEIPNSRLVCVPDAAHMPTIEQPELCNEAIGMFLASLETLQYAAPGHHGAAEATKRS